MYPRNAASPERLLIGQVILIADGTVQSSAVVITVRGQGGAEATGGNSAVFGADNSVYYTPTQAETNFTSFTVIASKASCLSAGLTVVTTASSTAGQVDVKSVAGTAQTANDNGLDINALITTIGAAGAGLTGIAAVGDVTNLSNLPTIPTNWITADGIAADAIGSSELADSAVTEIQTGLATSAELAVVDGIVDTILVDTGTTIPATLSTIDGIVDTILLDTNELQGDDVPGLIATLDAVVDTVKAETVLILADTADIQANYATATALATVDTNVDQILVDTGTTIPATIATVDGIVDTILVDTGTTIPATIATVDGNVDTLITQSATQVKGIIEGLAATGTLSTTQMTTNLSGYADDQLIGRTITWHTSGACDGEQAQIDDSANSGGLLSFTASALTTAPGNNDPFKIT